MGDMSAKTIKEQIIPMIIFLIQTVVTKYAHPSPQQKTKGETRTKQRQQTNTQKQTNKCKQKNQSSPDDD